MSKVHNFHIPVMGIAYTIDTPAKVAHLGIDSVISLVDDGLLEELRKVYCEKFKKTYEEISYKIEDYRAKRITSYLDLMQDVVKNKFNEFVENTLEKKEAFTEYWNSLPDSTRLKKDFLQWKDQLPDMEAIRKWVINRFVPGGIDVNIMTKVDASNYRRKQEKPSVLYNDAHAALRGFANSKLESSLILSAGMNPRLYGYIAEFDDFFPDQSGFIKKKVVLKVSDYRSAEIQGRFLAKKGIWVSEYRVESGLNCGGHAFASGGHLMGPILEEFKENRQHLYQSNFHILIQALQQAGRPVPVSLDMKITAQGGVGTSEEHDFLLDYYGLDSIGWGSPFLLVPEVTTIDSHTLNLVSEAAEEDLYLSDISPLGVPFNSLRTNSMDKIKHEEAARGNPGSHCPKRYLTRPTEYGDTPMCTASSQYQKKKLKELSIKELSESEYRREYHKIIDKACLCVGLGTPVLLVNELDTGKYRDGVTVCPGPNMAYFSGKRSLNEMLNHIYGKINLAHDNRPHMFIKELDLNVDYFKRLIAESIPESPSKILEKYQRNLLKGVDYYMNLFRKQKSYFTDIKTQILSSLQDRKKVLTSLLEQVDVE